MEPKFTLNLCSIGGYVPPQNSQKKNKFASNAICYRDVLELLSTNMIANFIYKADNCYIETPISLLLAADPSVTVIFFDKTATCEPEDFIKALSNKDVIKYSKNKIPMLVSYSDDLVDGFKEAGYPYLFFAKTSEDKEANHQLARYIASLFLQIAAGKTLLVAHQDSVSATYGYNKIGTANVPKLLVREDMNPNYIEIPVL